MRIPKRKLSDGHDGLVLLRAWCAKDGTGKRREERERHYYRQMVAVQRLAMYREQLPTAIVSRLVTVRRIGYRRFVTHVL